MLIFNQQFKLAYSRKVQNKYSSFPLKLNFYLRTLRNSPLSKILLGIFQRRGHGFGAWMQAVVHVARCAWTMPGIMTHKYHCRVTKMQTCAAVALQEKNTHSYLSLVQRVLDFLK